MSLRGLLYKLENELAHCSDEAYFSKKNILKVVNSLLYECELSNGNWIPVEERLPEPDTYILVSFSNFSVPDIGRYENGKEGGAFYPGDEDHSYSTFNLFVNAWMPLPEPYKEG